MDSQDFVPDPAAIAIIRSHIDRYERERASVQRNLAWRIPLYLAVSVVVVVVLAMWFNRLADRNEQWSSTPHVFLYVIGVVALPFLYAAAMRPATRLQNSFRERLLPLIFGFIDDIRYQKGGVPSSFERLPPEAVGDFNRESFDDVISGRHGGFAFELYEANLQQKAGKLTSTVFKGVIVSFDTASAFPGVLVATRKTAQVVSFFRGIFGGKPLETVKSGVADLDAIYDFQTDNVGAARPLVEGRLAQALAWLGETWPEEPARVALRGSDGFLLLPVSRNFFELPGPSVRLDYNTHVEPIIADMASLLATAALVRKIQPEDGVV